jgi:hypothetical protein
MYTHLTVNACLNILFCIVNILSLMNICIFPSGSFCSTILKHEATQLAKIYLVLFAGNALRLSCNFSYIIFSMSRFVSATSIKNTLKHINENLNFKIFYLITFVVSAGFSVFKLFENRVNEFYSSYDTSFPYNAYDIRYCKKIENWFKEANVIKPNCRLFSTLNVINNVLNNILFLVINLLLDVLMVRFSKRLIEHKRALNCPHLNDAIKLKEKLNRMIITNGTLFFVAHFPEFLVTALLMSFDEKIKHFCHIYFSCTELIEMAQTFHLVSIGLQFFILYGFDKNFKQSLADRMCVFWKKKNNSPTS